MHLQLAGQAKSKGAQEKQQVHQKTPFSCSATPFCLFSKRAIKILKYRLKCREKLIKVHASHKSS